MRYRALDSSRRHDLRPRPANFLINTPGRRPGDADPPAAADRRVVPRCDRGHALRTQILGQHAATYDQAIRERILDTEGVLGDHRLFQHADQPRLSASIATSTRSTAEATVTSRRCSSVTTYPLPTLAATGHRRRHLGAALRRHPGEPEGLVPLIFGSDVYLEADSQDGQLLAIIASAINDCNAAAIAVYNAFSPATAKGAGLSSVVKINGIAATWPPTRPPTLLITGQVGSADPERPGRRRRRQQVDPAGVVTIPIAGEIVVTATCTEAGAITACGERDHARS
jgi:hypothetical protein